MDQRPKYGIGVPPPQQTIGAPPGIRTLAESIANSSQYPAAQMPIPGWTVEPGYHDYQRIPHSQMPPPPWGMAAPMEASVEYRKKTPIWGF